MKQDLKKEKCEQLYKMSNIPGVQNNQQEPDSREHNGSIPSHKFVKQV